MDNSNTNPRKREFSRKSENNSGYSVRRGSKYRDSDNRYQDKDNSRKRFDNSGREDIKDSKKDYSRSNNYQKPRDNSERESRYNHDNYEDRNSRGHLDRRYSGKRDYDETSSPRSRRSDFGDRDFSKDERQHDTGVPRTRRRNPDERNTSRRGSGSDSRSPRSNERTSSYNKPKSNYQDRKAGSTREPSSRKGAKETSKNSDELRLNKFIANSGICARREADDLIKNGKISVNGKVITELGTKISYTDKVFYNGKTLSPEKKVYIVMNKPKGYVTTVEDPHADHTVLDILGDSVTERVYPVGRLDKDTTGVLLLTNDGDLTKKLTHPKFEKKKIYHVFLDKDIIKSDVFKLTEGVDVDGEMIVADAVSCPDANDRTQIGIELHSGQNRIVRRTMEAMGYKVKKLDRVYFAGLTKKNIQRGRWRYLTEKEIIMLKRGSY